MDRDFGLATRTVEMIAEEGGSAVPLAGDVTSDSDCRDIAREAVHAVVLAYRKMGPPTELTARLQAVAGIDETIDLLEAIMRGQVNVGGRFAPQVFECAAGGDAAHRILRQAGSPPAAQAGACERSSTSRSPTWHA